MKKWLEEIFMPSFYPPSISPFTLFPTGSYYFGHSKAEKLPIGDSSARNLPTEFPLWKFAYRIFHIQDICLRNIPRRSDWSFPRRTLPHHFRWRFPHRKFPFYLQDFPRRVSSSRFPLCSWVLSWWGNVKQHKYFKVEPFRINRFDGEVVRALG